MKKRILALALTLAALLCAAPASAAQGEAEVTVSTDFADLFLSGNVGDHYVRGNGTRHSPGESFLYANEKGGVTLVQYVSSTKGVAVAEFDAQLEFLNVRYLPVDGIAKWAGFCSGAEHNYIAYATAGYKTTDALRVLQYDKQWNLVNSNTFFFSNTASICYNDFDMVECGGVLSIITNRTMSDGTAAGHQGNMHVEISVASLTKTLEHTGVSSYVGYTSHSFVPEIIKSGSKLYTFDRSDTYPGAALYMSIFDGTFASGRMSYVRSMAFNDWGSLGNAVAAPGETAVATYNYLPAKIGSVWTENTDTNVYLYHSVGGEKQVSYNGGAGTPLVGTIGGSVGYVLWNPDLYLGAGELTQRGESDDTLYYAAYVANSSNVVPGAVLKADGHYLSDCEPIEFDGGLLWFTVEGRELVFHQLKPNSAPTKKAFHSFAAVAGREPTCARPGLTEGVACQYCGEVRVAQKEIPALPHTEEILSAREATCWREGLTEGARCSVCWGIIRPQEELPKLPHTEQSVDAVEPTCLKEGSTAGVRCAVCYAVVSGCDTIPVIDHNIVDVEEISPTAFAEGKTAGTACTMCSRYFSGGEAIPRTLLEITSCSVTDGQLSMSFERGGYFAVFMTFWDEDGQMVGVRIFPDRYSIGETTASFPCPAGAVSYQAFALNQTFLHPMRTPIVGTIQF